MKILHIGFGSTFTEGMSYQDNLLPAYNVKHGHDVTYIADCYKFENGVRIATSEEDKITEEGFRLIRLKYDLIINEFFSGKFKKCNKLYRVIYNISPDVILFHGCVGFELINVAKYVRQNPKVKFYTDSHEDRNNSGTNWLSLNVLHKGFNRWCINKALLYIEKIFYLSEETKDFLIDIFKLPEDKLEFWPLGGIMFSDEDRLRNRKEKRTELNLSYDDILLVHSGKMDKLKRTEDVIKAFSKVSSDNLRLIIIGMFTDDVEEVITPLINSDKRINYLGWKSSDELSKYLCASDLYVQPGGQSATMQNAICCGSPIAVYPHKSYKFFLRGNGFFIETVECMREVFNDIILHPEKIQVMRDNSLKFAHEVLDYDKVAERLYV